VFIAIPITSATGGSITLRSHYRSLSLSQVRSMANVSIHQKKGWGFKGHSTINHDYNPEIIRGDVVVVDNATGLMWHQGGSRNYMSLKKVKEWVWQLNSEGYAGYRDWRLPTVEEAASLLESSKKNGKLYIDPVFSKKQGWIWTGDRSSDRDGSEAAWTVRFGSGDVYRNYHYINIHNYVRPVRSME